MVEGPTGFRRYTEGMTDWELVNAEEVPFDELLQHPATRVVVVSPEHDTEEFLSIVDRMGLQRVSYSIGWTAWLDISPDGVSKATAMERVRHALGIPRSRVVAVGDGRNDLELLQWAGAEGLQRGDGPGPGRGQSGGDAGHRARRRRRSGAGARRALSALPACPCQACRRCALFRAGTIDVRYP